MCVYWSCLFHTHTQIHTHKRADMSDIVRSLSLCCIAYTCKRNNNSNISSSILHGCLLNCVCASEYLKWLQYHELPSGNFHCDLCSAIALSSSSCDSSVYVFVCVSLATLPTHQHCDVCELKQHTAVLNRSHNVFVIFSHDRNEDWHSYTLKALSRSRDDIFTLFFKRVF